jgi:hypothetical protein
MYKEQQKMAAKNGKTRELWGKKFTVSRNGLDEREVYSFIGHLIEQNSSYARKQEYRLPGETR